MKRECSENSYEILQDLLSSDPRGTVKGNGEDEPIETLGRLANRTNSRVLLLPFHCIKMHQNSVNDTDSRHPRMMASSTRSPVVSQSGQEMLFGPQRQSLAPPQIRIIRPSILSLSANPSEPPSGVTGAPTNMALNSHAIDTATTSIGDGERSEHLAEGRRQTPRRGLNGPGGSLGTTMGPPC